MDTTHSISSIGVLTTESWPIPIIPLVLFWS
ncbi:CRISPR-associated DxTHG motif protein [Spirosoma sp. BT704]|uniref:CRISPR-associated DxTHG motif protein n=1 Tax=Spirosoma validum TaxID=2771355 RepID=A0A927GDI3_9BACT|nr:CRISPR-associated DxTHG motif protein [Spirosoma validum]